MKFNTPRSIKTPIILGASSIALAITLLVGWILVLIQNSEQAEQAARANGWLMVGGIVSFVVIVVVLVLFSVFLVREILESRRQVRFIDSVTHELKSPLASLKLSVQTVNRRKLSDAQTSELHRRMLDDIDRLSAFIDDILAASRLEQDREALDCSEVNVRMLAERCTERVRGRYRAPRGAIQIDVPEDLTLQTSSTALETVLKNLLDNALKYSDEPTGIVLIAREGEGRVHFSVTDRGIGISQVHLKLIFNRFYRVPDENVNTRRGTGLGLYVVSSLVKTLGGQLTALSDGPGQGTTMQFALPMRYRRSS
ncbi:MAG: HAMP domain-containing sensor histidine kinase [Myxococcota bacterium]|nr:HAMP domain-containing sensor histidine kinase [Myxococcota bacterium]